MIEILTGSIYAYGTVLCRLMLGMTSYRILALRLL